MIVQLEVEDTIKKETKIQKGKTSAVIYVPKEWENREVVVCLLPKKKQG